MGTYATYDSLQSSRKLVKSRASQLADSKVFQIMQLLHCIQYTKPNPNPIEY